MHSFRDYFTRGGYPYFPGKCEHTICKSVSVQSIATTSPNFSDLLTLPGNRRPSINYPFPPDTHVVLAVPANVEEPVWPVVEIHPLVGEPLLDRRREVDAHAETLALKILVGGKERSVLVSLSKNPGKRFPARNPLHVSHVCACLRDGVYLV